jgi:hypothetical protein
VSVPGLLIALIGFAVVALFIAAPLLGRSVQAQEATPDAPPLEDREAELRAAYERIKSTLRDLDEDYALGKLDDAAYQAERERWLTEGAHVLAALDEVDAD